MKKLALGSLTLAALVSQTTGCIITSDDGDDFATITADWSFHTVNTRGQLSPENNCPPGFPTVALHSQELDGADRPVGLEVVDLFDCIDGRNFSDELLPGVYETFIRVTDDSGLSLYAESLPEIVDVRVNDVTIEPQIMDNGGYFSYAWDLRELQTNAPLECRDIAGLDGIEIAATLTNSTEGVTDIFDCEVGAAFSAPVMEGTYVISVAALDTTDKQISEDLTLNNKVMRNRNQVTDLGVLTIQVQ
jgi:hypothetical protein